MLLYKTIFTDILNKYKLRNLFHNPLQELIGSQFDREVIHDKI